ncbi:MAG: AAA family ATPase [Candidatus Latescibacterota bacterium]
MFGRNITHAVLSALSDTPVVLLHGARQTGKATLVRYLADGEHPARYLTLDDPVVLAAAQGDPHGFVSGLEGPVVLDEVQRAPGLALAIKAAVDRARTRARSLTPPAPPRREWAGARRQDGGGEHVASRQTVLLREVGLARIVAAPGPAGPARASQPCGSSLCPPQGPI